MELSPAVLPPHVSRKNGRDMEIAEVYARAGELPNSKDGGARQKYWKESLRGTKILFCGRGLNLD